MKRVDVLMVRYNQPKLELETARIALETAGHPSFSLVLHTNEKGKGLAACWNDMMADSVGAGYICLLNTDTVPTENWLVGLTDILDAHEDIFAVVPVSNRVHLSQIDTPWLTSFDPSRDEIERFAKTLEFGLVDLPTLSAMCVVFRNQGFQFDEEFFLYGEDTEFFYRMCKAGYGRLVAHTGVYVHHYGQQSMGAAVEAGEIDYAKLRADADALWHRKKGEIDARYPDKT